MAKRIFAVVIALAVAFGIILGFEQLGGVIFKTPGLDPRNPKTISDMMTNMPIAAFVWLLLGYAVSAFLGGLVATFIAGRNNVQPALIVGTFLTVGGIMNLIMIPYHPVWFMVVSILIYVPFAWLGYMAAKAKTQPATTPKS